MSEISKMIGHKSLFNDFVYLDQIHKLPNKILLNGPKGIGKKLFVNHFLNYFYLKDNKEFYNLKNYEYNLSNNISKLISSNSHPNILKIYKKNMQKRLRLRKNKNKYDNYDYNFYSKVQKGFLKIASKNKSKYLILDTNKDNLKIIENKLIDKIKKILK